MKKMLALFVCVCLSALAAAAYAVPVHFQWNASTGAVAGYKLYQGTASGAYDPAKTTTIPGTGTTGTMEMDPSASRYVAATAYDGGNRESAFSNEILCHPITVSSSSGGTVSPSGSFFVQNGRSVTFTLTPAKDFQLKSVTVNGAVQTVASGSFTLSAVTAKSTVVATYEAIPSPPPPTMLELVQQIATALDRIDGRLAAMQGRQTPFNPSDPITVE